MKKKLMTLLLFVSLGAILLPSCKKKDKDAEDDPEPVVTSVLCDGNGSNSYYPLTLGNNWSYTDGGSNKFSNNVSDTVTYGSNKFYEVSGSLGGTQYLRQAANGDIMTYDPFSATEYLFVPASPTVGQSWAYNMEFAKTRKIISVNASLSASCSYTDCLQIQTLDANGMVAHTYYYKKGIGMICSDQIAKGINSKLNAIVLK